MIFGVRMVGAVVDVSQNARYPRIASNSPTDPGGTEWQ